MKYKMRHGDVMFETSSGTKFVMGDDDTYYEKFLENCMDASYVGCRLQVLQKQGQALVDECLRNIRNWGHN